jgi:hypothetical protein
LSCLAAFLPGLINHVLCLGKFIFFLGQLLRHLINLIFVLPEQVPHMIFILLRLLQPCSGERVLPLNLRLQVLGFGLQLSALFAEIRDQFTGV